MSDNPERGIVRERLPGIVGGTATGMALPLLAIGGAAAVVAGGDGGGCGGDVFCCYDTGDGVSSGNGDCSPCKPTTWAAFAGSFAGSVAYGVKLAHDAYKAAGNVLNNSAIVPTFKGWGIGGGAGAVGAVTLVAAGEGIHYAVKKRQEHVQNANQQRTQSDIELGLRQPRGSGGVVYPSKTHAKGRE